MYLLLEIALRIAASALDAALVFDELKLGKLNEKVVFVSAETTNATKKYINKAPDANNKP